jgi:hypothetical protein
MVPRPARPLRGWPFAAGTTAACVHHPILGERVALDLCGWAVSNGTETLIVLRR